MSTMISMFTFTQLGFIALSILSIYTLAKPSDGFFSVREGKINLSSYAVSLGLNIVLTAMISGRMWASMIKGRKIIGKEYGEHYKIILTMFIESAALYSMNCIALLISYGMNHPISQIFLSLNLSVQVTV